jgi:hypothetical protein
LFSLSLSTLSWCNVRKLWKGSRSLIIWAMSPPTPGEIRSIASNMELLEKHSLLCAMEAISHLASRWRHTQVYWLCSLIHMTLNLIAINVCGLLIWNQEIKDDAKNWARAIVKVNLKNNDTIMNGFIFLLLALLRNNLF